MGGIRKKISWHTELSHLIHYYLYTQPILIFNRENPQNSESLNFIALDSAEKVFFHEPIPSLRNFDNKKLEIEKN
jgi:hypothetical protein